MFEKMGVTLAQSGQYEVFIIGYPSRVLPEFPEIQFIPLPHFHRLTYRRLWAKWQVFRIVWSLKPSLLIFNTHELLVPSVLLKIFMDLRIFYDVRENYYRNILFAGSFPWFISWPIACGVRFKEKLLAPAVEHFFLAEKGYEIEFKFHRGGWTFVENKALTLPKPSDTRKGASDMRLLFSGTLAESTGVFQAIHLAKKLHQLDASVSLTIIGYAAKANVLSKIRQEIQEQPFIQLIGGDQLVPHQQILAQIQQSDFGILSYPYSRHTENSLPTKLFEYLQAKLPIILERRWPWTKRFEGYKPFIYFDFLKEDYVTLLHEIRNGQFYLKPPEDVTWDSEAVKFLGALETVGHNS